MNIGEFLLVIRSLIFFFYVCDSIVGLGNPGLAYGPYFYEKATGEMPMPFFQNLVSELGLESVYGMVVNPNGGQITIGGLDWSHIYENAQDNVGMAWQEMLPEPTGATSFYITMGNMSINNVIVPASINQPVTVDTGKQTLFTKLAPWLNLARITIYRCFWNHRAMRHPVHLLRERPELFPLRFRLPADCWSHGL